MPHAVAWTLLDHAAREPVRPGDMISVEAGVTPVFLVVALEAGRAWIRTSEGAPARLMPLDRFQWRATAA